MAESLGSPDDWAELWRASGRGEMATTHIPIIVHEDAVPHFSGALGYVCSTRARTQRHTVFLLSFLACVPTLSFEDLLQQYGVGQLAVSGVTHGRPANA